MNMLKLSFYNIVIPNLSDESYIYVFNSKSGAIIKLESEVWNALRDSNFNSQNVQNNIVELLNQGIVVAANKNETQEIMFEMRAKQYEKREMLSLIVAPTLQCNYKCIYCFEDNVSPKMMGTYEIQKIIEFITKYQRKYSNVHKIFIHWFGGEPLLAYERVIEPLSDLLLNLTRKKNIEYCSKITTNGYLLNEHIFVPLIEKYKITNFQITFDGRCDNYHRMKRPPIDAYKTTKKNIILLSNYKEKVQREDLKIDIRINVDKTNIEDVKLFVQELKQSPGYKNNFNFYLGRIRGTCDSFNIEEFEHYQNEFDVFLKKEPKIFNPKKIWCNQFTLNSFCIGPSGELYKCENDFGRNERIIGDVATGLYYNEYLENYLNQTINEGCKNCKIFPICLGGCPNFRFHSKNKHLCSFTLNNIIRHVEEYVRLKKQNDVNSKYK